MPPRAIGHAIATDHDAEHASRARLEIFPVLERAGSIAVLVPSGASSWLVPYDLRSHPHDVVGDALARVGRAPIVVHSTSWRYDEDGGLVLTYLAVVRDGPAPAGMIERAVSRVPLARGGATTPPVRIASEAVLSHALEHLAWLLRTDAAVQSALSASWRAALERYCPKPFLSLDDDVSTGCE